MVLFSTRECLYASCIVWFVCSAMSTETSLSTICKQRVVIEFLTAEDCAPKEIYTFLAYQYQIFSIL